MKNKGFTLVEMLAAIVILSILIAIIVINFSNIFSSTQDKVYKTYEKFGSKSKSKSGFRSVIDRSYPNIPMYSKIKKK